MNPLTWIEILRQVLVAAGFGSKRDISLKEPPNKVMKMVCKGFQLVDNLIYIVF